jgi:hypothetical protein
VFPLGGGASQKTKTALRAAQRKTPKKGLPSHCVLGVPFGGGELHKKQKQHCVLHKEKHPKSK